MHASCVYIYCVCACSIDGWPDEESASHSHTSRVFAHRQRPHAIARVRMNTHAYPLPLSLLLHAPTLRRYIYIYIYIVHDVCVGYRSRRTYVPTHAHVMATAASSARTIACTCASHAVQPHARSYPSLTSTHLPIRMCMYNAYICMYTYISIHTYIPSFVSAAIPAHGHTRACARPHVCAHTRAHRRSPPRTTARAAPNTRRAHPARGGAPPGRKGGAYRLHVRHRRGVPRADVRVERLRIAERLRAEATARSTPMGKGSHGSGVRV
jgi:hypothetical protein